jgi:hypothetical protein
MKSRAIAGGPLQDLGFTAFARTPEKILLCYPRLAVVEGNPRQFDELGAALPGHDALISALGPRSRQAATCQPIARETQRTRKRLEFLAC